MTYHSQNPKNLLNREEREKAERVELCGFHEVDEEVTSIFRDQRSAWKKARRCVGTAKLVCICHPPCTGIWERSGAQGLCNPCHSFHEQRQLLYDSPSAMRALRSGSGKDFIYRRERELHTCHTTRDERIKSSGTASQA